MHRTAALILILSAVPALGQQQACGDRSAIVARLAEKYHERQVSVGINHNDTLVETWASQAGTFTILLTYPTGMACLIAAGEGWTEVEAVAEAPI